MRDHESILNSKFDYIAELTVELGGSSTEFARICDTLRSEVGTEILTAIPTKMGSRITCGIIDCASFLNSVPAVPGISSWRLLPS